MQEKKPIRIGLLLDSYDSFAWQHLMLSKIIGSPNYNICLVVKNCKDTPPRVSLWKKLIRRRKYLFYSIYRRLESKLFKNTIDAFEKKSLLPLLQDVKSIEVNCIQKRTSDYFNDGDIQKIKEEQIDVFIRLGFRILRGKILGIAPYGIWSMHHGDNIVNRGGPAGVWEIFEKKASTGSILQILTEDLDAGFVLYRSWSNTLNFIERNNNNSYWKAASFIPRRLELLYNLGWDAFREKMKPLNYPDKFYVNPLYLDPTNAQAAPPILKNLWKVSLSRIRRMFLHDQWILLYHFNKTGSLSRSLYRFKKLIPPPDRYWADPFVVFRNERYFLFVEEFIYKDDKGRIIVLEMDGKGAITSSSVILDLKYHLSYPFILEDGEELYMIPESSSNNTIEMYRCTRFPDQWEFYMNLMEGVFAVDCTIFKHNDKYWLFTNMRENIGGSTLDELFLFYADDFKTNQWTPHPLNPIISDVRRARPAGKLYFRDGKLYRPSQDCSVRYGYSIRLNEIKVMTETEYEEVEVGSISPDWDKNILGTHTLAHAHNLTVIDGVKEIWRL